MIARIFKPSKDASQSGLAGTRKWLLTFDPETPLEIDPLMGWTGSSDTRRQVRLKFDTQEEAVAYAKRQGIPFRVEKSLAAKPRAQRRNASYSDNFRFNRVDTWTH